jgi:replication factor C subunit 3/5
VEKYRPNDLSDIISHEEIITTVKKFIDTRKMPHLLFHGPPGTGKTSCIVAIAKHLYGPDKYKNMILELNASDDRGINVVREQIKSFCSTQQLMSKGIKLVILDECDSMTSSAQFALRRSK